MSETIPKGWQKKKLGQIGKFSTSSVDKKINPNEEFVYLLNYMDIYRNSILDEAHSFQQVTAHQKQILSSNVVNGDVFFTPSSETPDDIGHSCVFIGSIKSLVHSYHTIRYRTHSPDVLDDQFKAYAFKSNDTYVCFRKAATGSTRFTISLPVFKELEVLVPPLPEQKKIASILTSVDEVIENTKKQIDKLQDLKKATMNELLTKGIGHTEFKDSELGRIPKSWSDGHFEQFITLQRGTDLPVQDRKEGNIPIYGSNGIVGFHNDYVISGEGVITGRSGSIGDVYYSEERCWTLNTTLYVKDFHGNLPKYIAYFLQFFDLKKFASGTGVPTLNRNDVHPQYIAFPQFEEQLRICKILNHLDETIFQNIEKLKKTKSLKKSLMQDLLTGKVRVKVN